MQFKIPYNCVLVSALPFVNCETIFKSQVQCKMERGIAAFNSNLIGLIEIINFKFLEVCYLLLGT